MSRTQNTSALFTVHQTGNYEANNAINEPIGAMWWMVGPPIALVPPGAQQYGTWQVILTMSGPAEEKYWWNNNYPFPLTQATGLWDLTMHRVEGLVANYHAVGPDGRTYDQTIPYEEWIENDMRIPYFGQLTGELDGSLQMRCGVNDHGFHTVEATIFGEPIPWTPYEERIEDQHSPPSGQYAHIKTTETGAEVHANSGGDERFNAWVMGYWNLPLKTRVQIGCQDFEGYPVPNKKVYILFGPLYGTNYRHDHPLIENWLHERITPVDEVFEYATRQWWQIAQFEHTFLNNYSGNPNPPFPRTRRWGSQEVFSAMSVVAAVVDRQEFGLPKAPHPILEFLEPQPDYRNWLRSQFHPEANGTCQRVATLRLPPTLDLPEPEWQGVEGQTLEADGETTFTAALDPAYECRPYRYLRWQVSASEGIDVKLTLKQGSNAKLWFLTLIEGSQTVQIDLFDPDEINGTPREDLPTQSHENRAAAPHRGALSGRFSGIAGLSDVEVTTANVTLVHQGWHLKAYEAKLGQLGDGLPGPTPDEAWHLFYGQVDGCDAFRIPWNHPDIEKHLTDMGKRFNLVIENPDYEMSEEFLWRFDSWDGATAFPRRRTPAPAPAYAASFDEEMTRLPMGDLLTGVDVKMSLNGHGFLLHPGISEDAIFDGEEPFRCRFDLLWGWGASASAIGGGQAAMRVDRPGHWSEDFAAAPHGEITGLPPKSYAPNEQDVRLFARSDEANARPLYGSAIRQMAWLGRIPDAAAGAVDAVRHKVGLVVEAQVDESGVTVETRDAHGWSHISRVIEGASVSDARVSFHPDGTTMVVYVLDNEIKELRRQGLGDEWGAPVPITEGEAVAMAIEPRSAMELLAICDAGVWTALRRASHAEEWEEAGVIVIAAAARAGLAFHEDEEGTALFTVPTESGIRRFTSSDWGTTWNEVI